MNNKAILTILFAGILLMLVPLGTAEAFSGVGSGTEENPYLITNVNELQEMNDDLDAWYEISNDIDACDTVNWNSGEGFIPIGLFTGSFNGNAYAISDVFINSGSSNVGLFSSAVATIKNISLINVSINHPAGSGAAGSLVGYAYSGTSITNCYATGNVYNGYHYHCGGLVGGNNGTIVNSCFHGNVNADTHSWIYEVGGLVGTNYSGGTIRNCYSDGYVTGANAGGLVGNNYGVISNSYTIMHVDGGSAWSGGFVGKGSGSVVNSYAAGLLTVANPGSGFLDPFSAQGEDHSDCFWDKSISGWSSSRSAAIGKTTAEMKQQATFTNWDFSDDWVIIENVTYPFLRDIDWSLDLGILGGTISDSNTGEPIEGARVWVASMSDKSDMSNVNGLYGITGVPFDTLFVLKATHSDYYGGMASEVQVTEASPIQTVDIELTPAAGTSFRLVELDPNPNSDLMKIMAGGIGYRYYQVVDDANIARDDISIITDPPLGGPFDSNSAIRQGVVQIAVNTEDIADGQTVTVTHLAGVPLDPADQKSFVVNIEPLTQTKTWELRTEADLSITAVSITGLIESQGEIEITICDTQGSDAVPETIFISRKALLGSGVAASGEIAAYCRVTNLIGKGGSVGSGVSGSIGAQLRDQFAYPYHTTDIAENMGKLYLLLFPAIMLTPELEIIKRSLEAPFLGPYTEEKEAGLYLKGSGWSGGHLINDQLAETALLGFQYHDRELRGNIRTTGSFVQKHKEDKQALAVELTGDWYTDIAQGTGGIFPVYLFPEMLHSVHYVDGQLLNMRFELGFESGWILTEILLSFTWESGRIIPDGITAKEVEISITGPTSSLWRLISPNGIFGMLLYAAVVSEPQIPYLTEEAVREEVDKVFRKAQSTAEIVISSTYREVSHQVIVDPMPISLDIGAALLIDVGLKVGGKGRLTDKRELFVEVGRLNGINYYPTEKHSADDYDPLNITLDEVYIKALTDVGGPVIQGIFDYVEDTIQAGQEAIVIAGSSALRIGADVLEAGQQIVNVFEALAEPKMQMLAVTTDGNDSSEISYFGIGGTYQLEPADLNLPSPATFAISYSDDEVADHNELLLRMYRWDDANAKWELIGGSVDEVANTVTVVIDRFGTYTLGARVEYGDFIFQADPNTAPADGNSIVTFTSGQITNNDATPVVDGTLFTIALSGGSIISPDANTVVDGNQVAAEAGIVQFQLRAPQIAMQAKAEAISLSQLATISGTVAFTDSNAPSAPNDLRVEIAEGKVLVSWKRNPEIDLAGYRIYFDDDETGPPYNGAAYYSGQNSPVDVADANSHYLRGLQSGHTYYIALTAYDVAANESVYSSEAVFLNTLPQDSDSDGMPDDWELQYANAANGLDPTADDSGLDNDGDNMTNWDEYVWGTNPLRADAPDADGDGVWDGIDVCSDTPTGPRVDARGCVAGDLDLNGTVALPDVSLFTSYWLDRSCYASNSCEWADIDLSNTVDFNDFALFAENWLLGDMR